MPVALMIIACVIYGRAAQEHWNWFAIVSTYHIGFFAFNAANTVGITYLVDSVSHRYRVVVERGCILLTHNVVSKQSRSSTALAVCRKRIHLLRTELLHCTGCAGARIQDLNGYIRHCYRYSGRTCHPGVHLWKEHSGVDRPLYLEARKRLLVV